MGTIATSTPISRPGAVSRLMIACSLAVALGGSVALDLILLSDPRSAPTPIVLSAILFNVTVVLMSLVGAAIEWRRVGHAIGRLLLLAGPIYALLAASWLIGDRLAEIGDPAVADGLNWMGTILSYPGVTLIAAWIPLLFPTGTLAGQRWRLPVVGASLVLAVGVAAMAFRPGRLVEGMSWENPLGFDAWPTALQFLVDAIPLVLVALVLMAVASLVVRYRRGDVVERLQIRWLAAAVSVVAVGFVLVPSEDSIRTDDGPLASAMVIYAGILAMPIAIGIAILRYRLYDIDRIISRTIAYALVTAVLFAIFGGVNLVVQTALGSFVAGGTVSVAVSTLAVAALFNPIRSRFQRAVDRRFNRARYDRQRAIDAFALGIRDEVDVDRLLLRTEQAVRGAVEPSTVSAWRTAQPLRIEHVRRSP